METSTQFSLPETIALLDRTPATLDALLRGLPDIWVHRNEGKNTWSAFDVVGHLVSREHTDWMVRARMILENRGITGIRSLDRFAQCERESRQVGGAAPG